NILMHKQQLSIMIVGGPNQRTDFHVEEGGEFFFQIKGQMMLPTVQRGRREDVIIPEGHIFILPPRVPHSPQRKADTVGLVIERVREEGEMDCLRWYKDFDKCDEILFQRYFRCEDLGKDLVPVVEEYLRSEEYHSHQTTATSCPTPELIQDDTEIQVPAP
ncbi:hypothetical protein GUITHDRAFT_54734, partial [Guillardia theta CCMP2712]